MSTELPNVTDLAVLADRINAAHDAARAQVQSALDSAAECGRLLIQAKSQVPHGEWEAWLTANFRGSLRTARAYMQLASRLPELDQERQRVADLPLRDALQLLAQSKPDTQPVVPGDYLPGVIYVLVGDNHDMLVLRARDDHPEFLRYSYVRDGLPYEQYSARGFNKNYTHVAFQALDFHPIGWRTWTAEEAAESNLVAVTPSLWRQGVLAQLLGRRFDEVTSGSPTSARECP